MCFGPWPLPASLPFSPWGQRCVRARVCMPASSEHVYMWMLFVSIGEHECARVVGECACTCACVCERA